MGKFKTATKLLRHPLDLVQPLGSNGLLNWMSDRTYLKLVYKSKFGKTLNLQNPQTFNEKLQWLKLHDRNPKYTAMVDKYLVRDFIKEKIGEEYLIPLLGVWDEVDNIDFGTLPDKFVLKTNHDSQGVVICKDKSILNIKKTKFFLNNHLKNNGYWYGREWPYKNIKPRIICEKYISKDGESPDDYKVMCFNGEPKLIQVHKGRFSDHTTDYYDIDWNLMNLKTSVPNSGRITEKPPVLDEMLEVSKILSKDIRHIRVDFYYVNGKLFFGELTFFDASGYDYYPVEYSDLLGSWIDLPQEKIQ